MSSNMEWQMRKIASTILLLCCRKKSILRFCCIMQGCQLLLLHGRMAMVSDSNRQLWIEKINKRQNERMNKRALNALKHKHKTDKPCSPVYFNLKQFSILIPRETGLMYVIFKLILIFRFAFNVFAFPPFIGWICVCVRECASASL